MKRGASQQWHESTSKSDRIDLNIIYYQPHSTTHYEAREAAAKLHRTPTRRGLMS